MTDFDGKTYVAVYDKFQVGPGDDYTLTVGWFNDTLSTLRDSMHYNNQMKFSTKDRDQDMSNGDCAARATGGWWYNRCGLVLLTGQHTKPGTRLEGDKQIIYFDS